MKKLLLSLIAIVVAFGTSAFAQNSNFNKVTVKLDKTTLSLKVGASQSLKATATGMQVSIRDYKWSSSNTSVATVNNGRVNAVGAGVATITVSLKDGGSATCKVTVTKAGNASSGSGNHNINQAGDNGGRMNSTSANENGKGNNKGEKKGFE